MFYSFAMFFFFNLDQKVILSSPPSAHMRIFHSLKKVLAHCVLAVSSQRMIIRFRLTSSEMQGIPSSDKSGLITVRNHSYTVFQQNMISTCTMKNEQFK